MTALISPGGVGAQAPGNCAPPNGNPIACENALTGSPSAEWDVSGAGDATIQGFSTDISINRGQTISFKIDTSATTYELDIYRMGFYGGLGARRVATVTPSATLPQTQPACLSDPLTGLIDCGNWTVSASWDVPSTAVSGIYFAKLVRADTGGASHIVFVVRDDASHSDLLFQTSDTTWQAYNQYGGNSLYIGAPAGRAYKVSYNRPLTVRGTTNEDSVFNAEYPMVRWLEANGYDVSYFSGVDADRRGTDILQHKVFLSVGHDEYWSGTQRTNVENARAAGVNLAFFSGNEIFWKTRWENSISADGSPHRTLVSYKETQANDKIDPSAEWTGTWRDPRFSPPSNGGRPENALTGTIFSVNSGTTGIQVPAEEGKSRLWRNTAAATLPAGASLTLPSGTLGYEWDEDRDNGFRPAGLIRLSSTTVTGVQYLQDFGSTYGPGTANHAITLYRHQSGALVFGAGTIQWSWGLDDHHERDTAPVSLDMQQATLNLLADMGVQPLTSQPGLVQSAASADTVAPVSTITAPANEALVPGNATMTISGTATDSGGGFVGGVEISTDGGATWHRAVGRDTWTYAWHTSRSGTATLLSRAVDDSGNLEQPVTGSTVTLDSTVVCPCSIWDMGQTPLVAAANDPSAVEVGTRFRSDSAGYITGVRFYKALQNTGPHVGNLWTASGTLLATVNFAADTESGWHTATLANPVAITANTSYVVSYHTQSGYYSVDSGYFANSGMDNGNLHALRDGQDGPNGVYGYGSTHFPSQSYQGANYWVDVVFSTTVPADTTQPTVESASPKNGASGVVPGGAVKATFSEDVNASTISLATFGLRDSSNELVPATITYSSGTRTATLIPSTALDYSSTYTVTISGGTAGVKDPAGNPLASTVVWSFTTSRQPPPPPTSGPGGPILVVGSVSNPFSGYYAEILRTEGLNAFATNDISAIDPSVLADYDVVILGEIPLTAAQVAMFADWVGSGGNLIAMRPDKQLASLLGLADTSSALANGYIVVNSSAAPGAGIVAQSMQFHGIADQYALNGATAIATLYTDSATATTSPAVSLHNVGGNGGQAAAFAYDLARSIVYTRQGNPAWSGQERDGTTPMRSDDLFFGGSDTNWVDLGKVAIPQADEQQRLLAHLIEYMNADRKPLPKFWYFPRGLKAVVVMTGDDHANNGTTERFDIYNSKSPVDCRVDDWECVRATSYIYPNTPIAASAAAAFASQGFEIAVHVTTNCDDYTAASLEDNFAGDLGQFAAIFPDLPMPQSNRTHCVAWSDYDTQPRLELAHGIRLDTNYYYWPSTWINDHPGLFTGSGMPMRFAKADGTMIDVYQATTQMTDESGQSYQLNIDTLLDRALGPEGYYGAIVANMHTDTGTHPGSEAIVASAQARGVPIISAKQLLDWLDERNASAFENLSWTGNILSFGISTRAHALQAMVPTFSTGGAVTAVRLDGSPISYSLVTLKGVSYAVFAAPSGSYEVDYGTDITPPVISGVNATAAESSATITWTTNETSGSRVDYGLAPDSLTLSATQGASDTQHSVVLHNLSSGKQYYYRVTSIDSFGNASSAPTSTDTFTTVAPPKCPCSVWSASQVPALPSALDASSVELGMRFRSKQSGYITSIRFFKGAQNTGLHIGNLWTADGTLLGTVTFDGESPSGWQEATLPNPVTIAANTTYVVSYHTTSGGYAVDLNYFSTDGVENGPLQALRDGQDGPSGVYKYGPSAFPDETYESSNYWVDVAFSTTAGDTTPPVVSNLIVAAADTAAVVSWTTHEPATSRVDYGPSPTALGSTASMPEYATQHSVSLTGLTPATQYSCQVTSADGAGNSTTVSVATFTTAPPPSPSVRDTTVADFAAGTFGPETYIAQTSNGEVTLAPSIGNEFYGTALAAGWTATAWSTGGGATVDSGHLLVDGARVHTDVLVAPGSVLEFAATFTADGYQHAGFGVSLTDTPWAIFSTGTGGALYARTHTGGIATDTLIPGNWLNAPHRYAIDWNTSGIAFSIDGVQVVSHPVTIAAAMRPIVSDYNSGGGAIDVDWMRLVPYGSSGTFMSRVLDSGSINAWTSATWTATLPSGTSLALSARFGDTPVPDATWSEFRALSASGASLSESSRYIQYQAVLGSSGSFEPPALQDIAFTAAIRNP